MDLGLRGKVAMVAAASQGLGKAVALGFAREGANLAICSRNRAALEAVAEEARAHGVNVLAVPADVTRAEDISAFVERTVAHFGGVDILVTNAGGPPAGTFQDFPDDAPWQAAFELTLKRLSESTKAITCCCERAAPYGETAPLIGIPLSTARARDESARCTATSFAVLRLGKLRSGRTGRWGEIRDHAERSAQRPGRATWRVPVLDSGSRVGLPWLNRRGNRLDSPSLLGLPNAVKSP